MNRKRRYSRCGKGAWKICVCLIFGGMILLNTKIEAKSSTNYDIQLEESLLGGIFIYKKVCQ